MSCPSAAAKRCRAWQPEDEPEAFGSSGYFRVGHQVTGANELAGLLDRGGVLAALVIPPGFARRQAAGETALVQLLLHGANANTAAVAQGYAQRVVQDCALERLRRTGGRAPAPSVESRPRIWYNSELRYAYFILLSMIALAGMIVGVITTAASIVREKESGTIEQMLVTPVRSVEMIAARMLPMLLVGLFALFPSLLICAV